MSLWRVVNTARKAARVESAVREPGAYAGRRARARVLRGLGVGRAVSRLYRGR